MQEPMYKILETLVIPPLEIVCDANSTAYLVVMGNNTAQWFCLCF